MAVIEVVAGLVGVAFIVLFSELLSREYRVVRIVCATIIGTATWLVLYYHIREERRAIATTGRALIVAAGAVVYANFLIMPFYLLVENRPFYFSDAAYLSGVISSIAAGWMLSCWLIGRLLLGPVRILERGACLQCGYDLTGNQSGYCPECGGTVEDVLVRGADVS